MSPQADIRKAQRNKALRWSAILFGGFLLVTQQVYTYGPLTVFDKKINSELAGVSTSRDVFSKTGSVTFTGVFRAKGNEAGMVYIINAHDCFRSYSKAMLALNRNRLFTGITRSKGWVRVLGVGAAMAGLKTEGAA